MSPPRRWFQIHLSTAVVLMFVAGGLVCLNLEWNDVYLVPNYFGFGPLTVWQERGWPFVYWERPSLKAACGVPDRFYWETLIANVLVVTTALVLTFRLSESLIRRRETRKP
ncbi:MAG TPA: hypothetical protein VEK08_19120 [Planctomycetota bacterium]|nr:hypothetical protein [Planctomycetota bacterium]